MSMTVGVIWTSHSYRGYKTALIRSGMSLVCRIRIIMQCVLRSERHIYRTNEVEQNSGTEAAVPCHAG
jgi:hypothetical protein